jgi:ubiquinone/menaquinone biosynthesis C-methylase UbiE
VTHDVAGTGADGGLVVEGYDAGFLEELVELEQENFWYRARNDLIVWALARWFPRARSFVEVGCGNGIVLTAVADARPELALTALDPFTEGLAVAARRVPAAELVQGDARELPWSAEEFDVAGAFDVIEHIRDDDRALAELFRVVRPGGGLILTVPQHPALWSAADVYARHERRYRRAELVERVATAGFVVRHVTSFVVVLLPLLVASRLRRRVVDDAYDPLAELRLASSLNRLFGRLLAAELAATRRGVRWPAGGSLLLVAERPAGSTP